jgi:hypothetical protein
MTWLIVYASRPQLAHKGKEALNLSNMSSIGSTKLLSMMRNKIFEFRSKFHNFWSSKEFTMNLQAYEYFLNGLTKFTSI